MSICIHAYALGLATKVRQPRAGPLAGALQHLVACVTALACIPSFPRHVIEASCCYHGNFKDLLMPKLPVLGSPVDLKLDPSFPCCTLPVF